MRPATTTDTDTPLSWDHRTPTFNIPFVNLLSWRARVLAVGLPVVLPMAIIPVGTLKLFYTISVARAGATLPFMVCHLPDFIIRHQQCTATRKLVMALHFLHGFFVFLRVKYQSSLAPTTPFYTASFVV